MADISKYDSSVWEYVLNSKLNHFIPAVRAFWEHVGDIDVSGTGVFPVEGAPSGLMYRVTNTPVRSPIKNVQVFPFVPVSYLNLVNVAGGTNKMVSRVCASRNFKIDEFTIIEKSNLPSTYHSGQFVAFIPTDIFEQSKRLGKWVYLTVDEMVALMQDKVPLAVRQKIVTYL